MNSMQNTWGLLGKLQLASILIVFATATTVTGWIIGPLQQSSDGDNSILDPDLPSTLGGDVTGYVAVAFLLLAFGFLIFSLDKRPLGRHGRIGILLLGITGLLLAWGYRVLTKQVTGTNTAGVLLITFATPILLALIVSSVFSLKREYQGEQ